MQKEAYNKGVAATKRRVEMCRTLTKLVRSGKPLREIPTIFRQCVMNALKYEEERLKFELQFAKHGRAPAQPPRNKKIGTNGRDRPRIRLTQKAYNSMAKKLSHGVLQKITMQMGGSKTYL